MTSEQIIRLETALLDFVERAAGENATFEEVRALPEVAQVLTEMSRVY